MDFTLDKSHQLQQQLFRSFAENEIRPLAKDMDENEQYDLDLLKKLQKEMHLSLLFISHDLALVQALCNRILVMYQGKIVEEGTPDEVILHPREEYTKNLIDSVL